MYLTPDATQVENPSTSGAAARPIRFSPALNISKQLMDEALSILETPSRKRKRNCNEETGFLLFRWK
jgi:hypothetical protein